MRRVPLLIALAAAACLGGCGEDHVFDRQPFRPPSLHADRTDPRNVMEALRVAYSRRDTNGVRLLFDDTYSGTSIDQSNFGYVRRDFSRWDEVAHVAYLAHHPELRLSLKLVSSMTRGTDLADPPGWAFIVDPFDSIAVTDSLGKGYEVDFAHEFMEFHFVPHTPDTTSETDTTWTIVRWLEGRS